MNDNLQPIELKETCLYCARVRWGNFQYLGKGFWRHEECFPGSEPWKEWYRENPEKHTSAGDLLNVS